MMIFSSLEPDLLRTSRERRKERERERKNAKGRGWALQGEFSSCPGSRKEAKSEVSWRLSQPLALVIDGSDISSRLHRKKL